MDTATPSISRPELAALLGRPDAPLVLDVRRTPRFAESDRIVATARHCPPEDVARFAAENTPRDVVVYCVFGHEVGSGAAQVLREAGWNARYLEGGIEGGQPGVDTPADIAAWRAQPLPLVAKRPGQ